MLWLRHGCPISALYGDDGEMQCNKCGIDFKRMTPTEIQDIWHRKAAKVLAENKEAQELLNKGTLK